MKTRKVKGFTLIELIVVIAIIGVLAAILVPAMLGYVRKSKISSANSAAAGIQKAWNTILAEFDEQGVDVTTATWAYGTKDGVGVVSVDYDDITDDDALTDANTKLMSYFNDIKKLKPSGEWAVVLNGGACAASIVALDGTYVGTYPSGIISVDNYKDIFADMGDGDTKIGICLDELSEQFPDLVPDDYSAGAQTKPDKE